MNQAAWLPVAIAPFDRDLELAVVDSAGAHALLVRCRRVDHGWINAVTGKPIDVDPTHWRNWQDDA